MRYIPQRTLRTAATTVEAAIVIPVAFFLFMGILSGGMGIFVYQEMAHVTRETARFASVHGAQYAKTNVTKIADGTMPIVDHACLESYAKSQAVGLNAGQMQVTVQMTVLQPGAKSATKTETVGWDDTTENQSRSPYSAWTDENQTPSANVQQCNVVIVTITYPWSPPGMFGLATVNLTSTAVMPMSY
jgi:hypothetical protein